MSNHDLLQLVSSGTAFFDLSSWPKLGVSGSDALVWLSELLSDDVAGLGPGRALHSRMSGDGRPDGEVTVAVVGGHVLLVQDPDQDHSILDLVGQPEAEVELDDRTDDLALFAFPGRSVPPNAPGCAFSIPSCLGTGIDVFAMAEDRNHRLSLFSKVYTLAGDDELRLWRHNAGASRPR